MRIHIKARLVLGLLLALFGPSSLVAEPMLDTARAALERGEYEAALTAADGLVTSYPYDAFLIRSRALLESGRYAAAEEAARQAVALNPKSFDARFLLAVSLEKSGNQAQAELQYRRSFDFASNEFEAELASNAVNRMTSERDWKLSVSMGLIPSSNINKMTTNDTVELTVGTGTISSPDPYSGVGAAFGLNAEQSGYSNLSFGIVGQVFEDANLNSYVIEAAISPDLIDGMATNAAVQTSWKGGDLLLNQVSFNIQRNLILGGRDATAAAKTAYTRISSGEEVFEVSGAYSIPLEETPNYMLNGQIRADRQNSDSEKFASTGLGISLIAAVSSAHFDIETAISINLRDWDAAYSGYANIRSDRDLLMSTRISPRQYSFFGLKPVVRTSFWDRNSTLATEDKQSFDMYLGVEAGL